MLTDHLTQRLARANFQEQTRFIAEEDRESVGEPHRLPDVTGPTLSAAIRDQVKRGAIDGTLLLKYAVPSFIGPRRQTATARELRQILTDIEAL